MPFNIDPPPRPKRIQNACLTSLTDRGLLLRQDTGREHSYVLSSSLSERDCVDLTSALLAEVVALHKQVYTLKLAKWQSEYGSEDRFPI